MIKPCSIIYFPGTGGNFIATCLTLSPETVPYYNKDLHKLDEQELIAVQQLSADQRLSIMSYNSLDDYVRIHQYSDHDKLYTPDFYYGDPLIDNYFDYSIVQNHYNDYHSRLPWLDSIISLEFDFDRYGHWIKNAKDFFHNRGVRFPQCSPSPEKFQEQQTVNLLPQTHIVSMTLILEGIDQFISEYQRMCARLSITPQLAQACKHYQDWRRFRVDDFL